MVMIVNLMTSILWIAVVSEQLSTPVDRARVFTLRMLMFLANYG